MLGVLDRNKPPGGASHMASASAPIFARTGSKGAIASSDVAGDRCDSRHAASPMHISLAASPSADFGPPSADLA